MNRMREEGHAKRQSADWKWREPRTGIQRHDAPLQSFRLGIFLAKSVAMFNLNMRGKRTSKCVQVEHAEAVVPSRRPGRPLKRVFELATKRKRRDTSTGGTTGTLGHESHQLSKLEQLPEEILEQVFLHCLEINLPRSSLIFGRGLAQNRIYKSLLLLAFFDDDAQHTVPTQLFEPTPYRLLGIEEKLRLQANLMTCKWFNLELVKILMPELSFVAMVHACHMEIAGDHRCVVAWPRAINQGDGQYTPKREEQEALARHFMATEDGEYLPRIVCAYDQTYTDPTSYKWTPLGIDRGIFNVRVVPDRYLDVPTWTSARIEMLRLLRHGWRFVQSEGELTISVNALFAGLKRAIIESNIMALKVLLELHYAVYVRCPNYSFDDGWRVRSFTYPLPIGMYHMATRQGRSSSKLFKMLFRADVTSLKKYSTDRIVVKWAVTESRNGDPFAQFLLEFMAGFGRIDGDSFAFSNGVAKPGRASTRMILREIHGHDPPYKTWTEELGYLDQRRNWPMRAEGYART